MLNVLELAITLMPTSTSNSSASAAPPMLALCSDATNVSFMTPLAGLADITPEAVLVTMGANGHAAAIGVLYGRRAIASQLHFLVAR